VISFANSQAPNQSAIPTDAAQQSDGKIVVAMGFEHSSIATEGFGVVRFNSNGSLDTTFGTNGSVQTAFTNFTNMPNSLALQPDGKIVVAGVAATSDGTTSEFAIARFNTNGTLDSTFGIGGKVTTNFVGVKGGVSNPANAVLIEADGKILVGGSASECPRCVTHTALARYNLDGSLDSSFGTNGIVDVTAIGPADALAEDAAGNIFAVNGNAGMIAEFSAFGMRDSNITPAPVVISSHGFYGATRFQPDGNYLVGESVIDNGRSDRDVKVVRFLQTGATDRTFNNRAFDYSAEGSAAVDSAAALALQPDRQVVIVGSRFAGGFDIFGVARLNTDGSLDSTFGTGGTLTTTFPGQTSAAGTAVVIQSDGKIVAVGQTLTSSGIANLALARYLGQ
jgi:uncharacterized delta-60 repeat protein